MNSEDSHMTPLELADLICPEIRKLTDELQDRISADINSLAKLVAMSVEMELGCEQYPDSPLYARQSIRADRLVAEWVKSKIRHLAEDRATAHFGYADDTEKLDRLYRAQDLSAGAR